ncbi:MAG: sigma 54-interacting transcriptional regulator, partial [Deltaproteobacteria bacterium]|nr:sigma 54-interacting transcriptional regulator [Deltaproteobacteria bacterium]
PINQRIPLKPFDCLKIGQEIYIFDPSLDVINGPAPAALVLYFVSENQANITDIPVKEAAGALDSRQSELISSFAYSLCLASREQITSLLISFLEENLGVTAVSILWPGGTGPLKQISQLSHPQDKRLLVSSVPYKKVTDLGHAVIWPQIITELYFNAGQRNIEQHEQPCLLAPLFSGDDDRMGVLYLENANRNFELYDLRLLAAAALTVSPFLKHSLLQASLEWSQRTDAGIEAGESVASLIGRDQQIKFIYSTASHLAQDNRPIFITGEVGTGKTSLARHIHQQSPKKKGRFVDVTLSGMSQAQMDLLLFGQEGGTDNQTGLFTLADNGTIFLRHIEHVPLSTQKSLLMTLEEGLVYPLEANYPRTVSVRFVTSSSANLLELVERGAFREDFYNRLTAINLSLPPLRDTREDIENLAHHYVSRHAKYSGLPFNSIDPSVVECLKAYPWPGNITEFQNACQTMAQFSRDGYVVLDCLPVHLRLAPEAFNHGDSITGDTLLGEAERCFITKTLSIHKGDIEYSGRVLGLSPEVLIRKIRIYGLDPMDFQVTSSDQIDRGPGQTSLPEFE